MLRTKPLRVSRRFALQSFTQGNLTMGMFDSVYAACPACGEAVEFQSKEGECFLNTYTVDDAPANVLVDVLNDPKYCRGCGAWIALVDPAYPPGQPPRPAAKPVLLREPTADEISIHSSQPFLRWWESPFSFDDIRDRDGRPEGSETGTGSTEGNSPAPQGDRP